MQTINHDHSNLRMTLFYNIHHVNDYVVDSKVKM